MFDTTLFTFLTFLIIQGNCQLKHSWNKLSLKTLRNKQRDHISLFLLLQHIKSMHEKEMTLKWHLKKSKNKKIFLTCKQKKGNQSVCMGNGSVVEARMLALQVFISLSRLLRKCTACEMQQNNTIMHNSCRSKGVSRCNDEESN